MSAWRDRENRKTQTCLTRPMAEGHPRFVGVTEMAYHFYRRIMKLRQGPSAAVIAPTSHKLPSAWCARVRCSASTGPRYFRLAYGNNKPPNMFAVSPAGRPGLGKCRAADIRCNPYLGAAMILGRWPGRYPRGRWNPGRRTARTCLNKLQRTRKGRGDGPLRLPAARTWARRLDPLEPTGLCAKQVFGEAMFRTLSVQFQRREEWTAITPNVSGGKFQLYLNFLLISLRQQKLGAPFCCALL